MTTKVQIKNLLYYLWCPLKHLKSCCQLYKGKNAKVAGMTNDEEWEHQIGRRRFDVWCNGSSGGEAFWSRSGGLGSNSGKLREEIERYINTPGIPLRTSDGKFWDPLCTVVGRHEQPQEVSYVSSLISQVSPWLSQQHQLHPKETLVIVHWYSLLGVQDLRHVSPAPLFSWVRTRMLSGRTLKRCTLVAIQTFSCWKRWSSARRRNLILLN